MLTYGDGNGYGVGTYGGRSFVQWCDDLVTTSSFEDVECELDLPAYPCNED